MTINRNHSVMIYHSKKRHLRMPFCFLEFHFKKLCPLMDATEDSDPFIVNAVCSLGVFLQVTGQCMTFERTHLPVNSKIYFLEEMANHEARFFFRVDGRPRGVSRGTQRQSHLEKTRAQRIGTMKGKLTLPNDIDTSLPEDVLESFER
ncbi:hypothetical protein [Pseudomonas fitomaticsae]|uniref:hypothetical protein n=1 Tax=Pseudomonas fitomaticsae TaxID=2837969 RepID=UPI001E5F350F|nr:hypothetical protein [Pseudomonas fitomaticsae]